MNKNHSGKESKKAPGPTPFDAIWSRLATGTLTTAIVTFTLLSMGQASVFGTGIPVTQDDFKINIAYFGAFFCTAGVCAMGLIALNFLKAPEATQGIQWPRHMLLESERRRLSIARCSLFIVLSVNTIAIYSALYRYMRDSKIACWDSSKPLAKGFFTSRIEAIFNPHSCPGMFRMIAKDGKEPYGVEWFLWSDLLLILILTLAITVWGLYFYKKN